MVKLANSGQIRLSLLLSFLQQTNEMFFRPSIKMLNTCLMCVPSHLEWM